MIAGIENSGRINRYGSAKSPKSPNKVKVNPVIIVILESSFM
jgi:hypothetical protein